MKEKPTIKEQFKAFDKANPHIYKLFRKFTRIARNAGLPKYSADAILHRIRWHLDVEVIHTEADIDPFKINNNYSAHYARKMMKRNPAFQGFFETRVLKNGKGKKK